MTATKHLVLQLLLLATIMGCMVQGFQSDKLPGNTEEWGLVGDVPLVLFHQKQGCNNAGGGIQQCHGHGQEEGLGRRC